MINTYEELRVDQLQHSIAEGELGYYKYLPSLNAYDFPDVFQTLQQLGVDCFELIIRRSGGMIFRLSTEQASKLPQFESDDWDGKLPMLLNRLEGQIEDGDWSGWPMAREHSQSNALEFIQHIFGKQELQGLEEVAIFRFFHDSTFEVADRDRVAGLLSPSSSEIVSSI